MYNAATGFGKIEGNGYLGPLTAPFLRRILKAT